MLEQYCAVSGLRLINVLRGKYNKTEHIDLLEETSRFDTNVNHMIEHWENRFSGISENGIV